MLSNDIKKKPQGCLSGFIEAMLNAFESERRKKREEEEEEERQAFLRLAHLNLSKRGRKGSSISEQNYNSSNSSIRSSMRAQTSKNISTEVNVTHAHYQQQPTSQTHPSNTLVRTNDSLHPWLRGSTSSNPETPQFIETSRTPTIHIHTQLSNNNYRINERPIIADTKVMRSNMQPHYVPRGSNNSQNSRPSSLIIQRQNSYSSHNTVESPTSICLPSRRIEPPCPPPRKDYLASHRESTFSNRESFQLGKTTRSHTFHTHTQPLSHEYRIIKNPDVNRSNTQSHSGSCNFYNSRPSSLLIQRQGSFSSQNTAESQLTTASAYIQTHRKYPPRPPVRSDSLKSPPSYVTQRFREDRGSPYINHEDFIQTIDPYVYLTKLTENLEERLGIEDGSEKKRILFNHSLTEELNKICEKEKEQAVTPFFPSLFSKNKYALEVIGRGVVSSMPMGLILVSAGSVFFSYFLMRELFKKISHKKKSKKLLNFLPREGSLILPLISLLTILFLEGNINFLVATNKVSIVKTLCPEFILKLLATIHSQNGCEALISEWQEQEKEIVTLAKKYAKQIFKKLELYIDDKDKSKDDLFNDLIPPYMHISKHQTTELIQDKSSLMAFFAALSRFIHDQKNDSYGPSHVVSYLKLIEALKKKTERDLIEEFLQKPRKTSLASTYDSAIGSEYTSISGGSATCSNCCEPLNDYSNTYRLI